MAFVLALAACKSKSGEAQGPPQAMAIPVKVATIQPTDVQQTAEYVAVIKSRHSVTLQPQVEGQIVKIAVKSGDAVKRGQLMVEIDPAKQEATVNSQEASYRSKQANLQLAKIQLDRVKALYASKVASKQELDQAQTAFDTAQADVHALEATVKEQKVQLHYYDVAAPNDGIVGDIPVHVGDRVTTSTVLTTVDEKAGLEAYINVPADRASQLHTGAPVQLLDQDGKTMADTRVTFISPQADPTTQSVLVKATLNGAQNLRPSQYVRARVVWTSQPGLVVPVLAVTRVSGQYFVFLAESQGKQTVARQQAIEVGDIVGDNYVVQKGLKQGDRVIVSGVQNLADNTPVQIGQ